jgi:hypothetical protein
MSLSLGGRPRLLGAGSELPLVSAMLMSKKPSIDFEIAFEKARRPLAERWGVVFEVLDLGRPRFLLAMTLPSFAIGTDHAINV